MCSKTRILPSSLYKMDAAGDEYNYQVSLRANLIEGTGY